MHRLQHMGPHTSAPLTPLTEKDIRKGTLVRVRGSGPAGSWDCPGIIVQVDEEARTFQVMTFDDMEVVDQRYTFDAGAGAAPSRRNMEIVPIEQAKAYVETKRAELEDTAKTAQTKFTDYDAASKKLSFG